MSTHPHIGRICAAAAVLSLLLSAAVAHGEALGIQSVSPAAGYEARLFDASRVHTVELVMEDWDSFLETCENEAYAPCAVVIDGEAYRNVGLRAKGNTSLRTVSAMGSSRYSFKLEFDQYDEAKSYYGLDKLCLNNLIQDNTCMKDYLVYRMMGEFGVASPLCSYVYVTVNGEDWGLYLAVEGVEESFLRRNYGSQYGELYKPDSTDMRAMNADDVKLQYIDEDPDSYGNLFGSAKTEAAQADQARLIQALKALGQDGAAETAVETERVLRYFVVHNFVVNRDSYTGDMIHNYYLYEEDGRLEMIPWDYNLAFGTFQAGDASGAVNDPIDTPLSVTGSGDRPMIDWIFRSEEYTSLYHRYFAEFLETVDPVALADEAYALIAPYVERDPTKFCTTEEFEAGVEALKEFCRLRTQSVSGQLAGSIPSTREGQSAGSSRLVSVDGLRLADMGTMNGGGGQPAEFSGRDGFTPGDQAVPAGGFPGEGMGPGDRGEPPEGGFPENGGGPPENGGPEGGGPETSEEGSAPLLLGVSVLVLLAGLLLAFRFRRFGG